MTSTTSRSSNAEDCRITSDFGEKHPYNFCIRPAEEVLGKNKKCDDFGINCIKDNTFGLGKYIKGLFVNSKDILDSNCGQKLGNKYVMKTGSQCIDVSYQNKVDRYTYVNNTDNNKFFGMSTPLSSDNAGILPASLSKATRINGGGFFFSLINDTFPECKEVKLRCHILNKNRKLYQGNSPCVHIPIDELDYIDPDDIIDPTNDPCVEPMTNMSNNINMSNNNISNNNILNDSYYILLSLLLLFIIYKMLNKK